MGSHPFSDCQINYIALLLGNLDHVWSENQYYCKTALSKAISSCVRLWVGGSMETSLRCARGPCWTTQELHPPPVQGFSLWDQRSWSSCKPSQSLHTPLTPLHQTGLQVADPTSLAAATASFPSISHVYGRQMVTLPNEFNRALTKWENGPRTRIISLLFPDHHTDSCSHYSLRQEIDHLSVSARLWVPDIPHRKHYLDV